jgi:hypothetical protein
VTLQAILDCAYAFLDHYEEDLETWLMVRTACEDLLGTEAYRRYQDLSQTDGFDYDVEENRLSEWESILKKFYPDDEEVWSSDHEGEIDRLDESEINSKVMKEKVIAHHQLKAFSSFVRGQPAQVVEAYQQFLVSIFSFLHVFLLQRLNLTPSLFCRCSTVVRLLPTGRPGRHWFFPR